MPRRRTKAELAEIQSTISDQLDAMPDAYLVCRDPGLRHKWDLVTNFHAIPVKMVGRKRANLERISACQRCNVRKVERFIVNSDDLIEKVSQNYDYSEAPGYLMSGIGVPRGLKRSNVVWSANYRRAMEKVAEQASSGKGSSSVVEMKKRVRKAG